MNETTYISLKESINPDDYIAPCIIGNEYLFHDFVRILSFIQQLSQLERIKNFNLDQLADFLDEHAKHKTVYTERFPDDLITVNALTNNLLSSERQVLDKVQSSSSLLPDEIFRKCDSLRRNYYDHDFSFRFLYDMRNLTQHTGLAVAMDYKGKFSFDLNQILDENFNFKNSDEYKDITERIREEFNDTATLQYDCIVASYTNDVYKIQAVFDEALRDQFYRKYKPLTAFLKNNIKELQFYIERDNAITYEADNGELHAINSLNGSDQFVDNWLNAIKDRATIWNKWCEANMAKMR